MRRPPKKRPRTKEWRTEEDGALSYYCPDSGLKFVVDQLANGMGRIDVTMRLTMTVYNHSETPDKMHDIMEAALNSIGDAFDNYPFRRDEE